MLLLPEFTPLLARTMMQLLCYLPKNTTYIAAQPEEDQEFALTVHAKLAAAAAVVQNIEGKVTTLRRIIALWGEIFQGLLQLIVDYMVSKTGSLDL